VELRELTASIRNFADLSEFEKIKLFGWYLHTEKGKDRFSVGEIRGCYAQLHMLEATNVSSYLHQLGDRKPPEVLRDKRGYYLEGRVREQLDSKHGRRPTTVQVEKALMELPGKISSETERRFLNEALGSYRCGAFRAAVVMSWLLAYDHLLDFVLAKHLDAFNAAIDRRYQNKSQKHVTAKEDFAANLHGEAEVIELCKSAGIIDNNLRDILDERLRGRNRAAHPSMIEISQLVAESHMIDLVENVVLKLIV
jgi:hypothetical protein